MMKKDTKTISTDRETQTINSYNKRKLGQLKKRRNMRKTKILVVRIRFFARILSMALLIWVFTVIVRLPQWYLNKNIFTARPAKYLQIEGNKIVSEKQIFDKLKNLKLPHKPVYLVNTSPVEKKLLELIPVKKVFVRRYWFPARLKIIVDERTPVLSIAPTPKVAPIAVFTNDDGVVKILDKEFLPLPPMKETYKVITYDQFSLWKQSLVQYISQFAYYIENSTDQKLEYLDIRDPDDAFVQLKDVKLRIGPMHGNSPFANINKVIPALPEALKIKEQIEYIDLRWENVSIKLKQKKQEEQKEKPKKEED